MQKTTMAAVWALALAAGVCAQTAPDLGRQGRNIDFSGAAYTRPVKQGTVLPSNCAVGELYFKTDAAAGRNLYACTGVATWTELKGSELAVVGAAGAVLTSSGAAAEWKSASGDASGRIDGLRVTGLQGRPVTVTPPLDGDVLRWKQITGQWETVPQNQAKYFITNDLATDGEMTFWTAGDTAQQAGFSWKAPGANRGSALRLAGPMADPVDGAIPKFTAKDGAGVSQMSWAAPGTDYVQPARQVRTSAPLAGGGALTGDVTLSCPTCVTTAYALPMASAGTLGGVKVGAGLAVDGLGVLSSTVGGGTVSSVGLAMPTLFTVTGSPVTGAGTLAAALAVQSVGTVLAGPVSGGAAAPAFRALAAGDVPDLDASRITTGQMAAGRLGSGAASAATYLRGDGTWATPGGGGVTAGSADTLTNKTIDAEGAGNTVTIPVKLWLPAVSCAGSSGALMWDTLAALSPAATCSAGATETTAMRGVAEFPDSDGDYSMQQTILLPGDWTGAVDLKIIWRTNLAAGNVVFQEGLACAAEGEADDVAYTVGAFPAVTAKSTANLLNTASLSGIAPAGCAAGKLMHVKIFRNRTHASDTLGTGGIVSIAGVEITARRAM